MTDEGDTPHAVRALQAFSRATPPFPGRGRMLRLAYRMLGYTPGREIPASFIVRGARVRFRGDLAYGGERKAILSGIYEPVESGLMDRHVAEGDWVLDIGGNAGLHTVRLAALVGKGGRVVAFEPVAALRERLLRNCALNGFTHVQVRNEAVSSSAGTQLIYVDPPGFHHFNATLVDDRSGESSRIPAPIATVRLDDLDFEKRVAFVKMDIEGYELEALRGGERFIQRHRPVVLAEYNRLFASQLGYRLEDLASQVTRCAEYDVYTVTREGVDRSLAEPTERQAIVLFAPRERSA